MGNILISNIFEGFGFIVGVALGLLWLNLIINGIIGLKVIINYWKNRG